jgi:hypothetical protein
MKSTELVLLHAEHLRALAAARLAYDLAVAAYRAAPDGPHKEQSQQAMYAAGDVVNLVQGCAYTTGQAVRT